MSRVRWLLVVCTVLGVGCGEGAVDDPFVAGQLDDNDAELALTAATPIAELAPNDYADDFRGWPVLPLHQQHPIRGSFMDPRPWPLPNGKESGVYHNGVDILVNDRVIEKGAPRGKAHRVYAIEGGTVWDAKTGGTCGNTRIAHFGYGHVAPVVKLGQKVKAGQFIGWTCKGMWHLHLSEFTYEDGQFHRKNPMRKGGKLGPLSDTAAPIVREVEFYTASNIAWRSRDQVLTSPITGTRVPATGLHGQVDARAFIRDPQTFTGFMTGPLAVLHAPHAPARIEVLVRRASDGAQVIDQKTFDGDELVDDWTFPIPFDTHFAPGTSQNRKAGLCLKEQPEDCRGEYWFRLFARPDGYLWDTTQLPNGAYLLEVHAWDTRDNEGTLSVPVQIAN